MLGERPLEQREVHSPDGSVSIVIDLRSDTVTRPTRGMRAAIAEAAVGDEQKREDPTVTALQDRVAALLGHEAALFLPTATMANQIALKLHGRPGDVLLAEETSHVLVYEYGGAAVHAGLLTQGLPGVGGRITPEQLREAAAAEHEGRRPARRGPLPRGHPQQRGRTRVAAGRPRRGDRRPPGSSSSRCTSTEHALLNAAIAQGVSPAAIASRFDTVTLCLSKGLGCPLGAVLAGSRELDGARVAREAPLRRRDAPGGDRRRGRRLRARPQRRSPRGRPRSRAGLAEGLAAAGVPVDLDRVETNFVQIDLALLGLDRGATLGLLRERGVGLSATIHPTVIRAVTHLDVDRRRHRARDRDRRDALAG